MTKDDKVGYDDLTHGLRTFVILGWIIIGLTILGIIIGIMEGILTGGI